ncbi:MAG: von Willebrand factor type A domain-containing protein [Myxococcales bacterium]|nr:von Willebrand factor type A domain-containing protein [Myxococcales bacterium]
MRRGHIGFGVGMALILGLGIAWAQATGGVKGKVTAAGGGPLAGVTVEVAAAGAKTTTGRDGSYALAGLPAGRHTVKASKPGYSAATGTVTVAAGKTATLNLTLRPVPAKTPSPEPVAAEEAEKREAKPMPKPTRRPSKKMKARSRRDSRNPFDMASGAAALAPPPAGIAVAPREPAQPEMNREAYDRIEENTFKSALRDPLSTFSIDVDTASYANVRRILGESRMPPKDAVRIEELINYFTYDYAGPKDDVPFAVHTEVSTAPWNPKHRLVHIGLQGLKVDTAALPPSNLVFLFDVSGSMNSPDKLPLLKAAFRLLVDNLRPQDRVAIVVYAGAAGLVLPSTPGKQKPEILAAIDRLSAGGSTAGGAGIKLAYKVARDNFVKGGNNRIILATDGDFNVGASSDGELERMIEQERESGVFLTILGFGRGNYQDAKMEKLSNKGNGNAAYIDSILEAKKVLVTEMGGTLLTIAKDVKIQVEFNPAKVKGYRLVGYENRALANEDFNDDKKDAGELGAGHSVTVLYEIIPAGSDEAIPGVDALKYQTGGVSEAAKKSPELMTVKLRYKAPDGDTSKLITHPVIDAETPLAKTSADFRFSAAVAGFGMLLRDSKFKGDLTWDAVAQQAKGAMGDDGESYRFEFVQLVKKAALLAQSN